MNVKSKIKKLIIVEGNRERKMLDLLTDRVKSLCKRYNVNLISAEAKKDEWESYVYDFTISAPIPEFPFRIFAMTLEKMLGAMVKQGSDINNKHKIRILV